MGKEVSHLGRSAFASRYGKGGEMSKYSPLQKYLQAYPGNSVELTFCQIQRIIGSQLPPNTRKYFKGWDNTSGGALNNAFLNAGWKTVMVDLQDEKVRWIR